MHSSRSVFIVKPLNFCVSVTTSPTLLIEWPVGLVQGVESLANSPKELTKHLVDRHLQEETSTSSEQEAEESHLEKPKDIGPFICPFSGCTKKKCYAKKSGLSRHYLSRTNQIRLLIESS